jgi:hypothetical protein
LIGDVDKQKKKALSIAKNALSIELEHNIQTRFILVYDLTNPSPQYKEQVKLFLEELSALRKEAGIKEYFDTIQIILPINNLRSPVDVINFFSFHRGAFNVGWGKFSKLSSSRLLKAQDWLLEFSNISQGKIDLNINNNLNNLKFINDKDAFSQAINNMKRVLFIQDDGQIELGDFTAFGEFDTRALLGLNHNPLLASSILKQEWKAFSRQKKCLSCSYQKECMFLGGHKIAQFNNAHNPNVSQIDCPSLLKPLIERVYTVSC